MSDDKSPAIAGLERLQGEGSYCLPGYGIKVAAYVVAWSAEPLEWMLMTIRVHPDLRGEGLGSQLLEAICAAADAQGSVLRLTIEMLEPAGLDDDLLGSWYERHGFTYKDDLHYIMVRQPGGRHE